MAVFPNVQNNLKGDKIIKVCNKGAHSLLLTKLSKLYATGDCGNMATGLNGNSNRFQQVEFLKD